MKRFFNLGVAALLGASPVFSTPIAVATTPENPTAVATPLQPLGWPHPLAPPFGYGFC